MSYLLTTGILQQAANPAVTLLLDDAAFSSHQIVLSVRRLKTAYTGNCMEVRRSSDNATQNIGFINNYLDTVSLLSFVGSGSGFVKTWYDQSGNGRDYIQNTNANQPRIVNAGSLETQNGKAAVRFDGSTSRLASAADYTLNMDQSIYLVNAPTNNITAATSFQCLIDGGPLTSGSENNTVISYGSVTGNLTNERLSYLLAAQRISAPAGVQIYGYGQTSADITAGNYLHNFSSRDNIGAVQVNVSQNGTGQSLSTSSYSGFIISNPKRWPTIFRGLGYRSVNNSGHFNGKIQEYILFNSYINNNSTINTSVNGFYSIW